MEVKIIAILERARSAVWLKKLIRDLGEKDNNNNPFIPILYCDNKGTVDLLYNIKHY